jgi:hypothetical protein
MGAKVAFLGLEAPGESQQEVKGVLVASEALYEDASGDYVWRISDNVVERRSVEIAGSRDRDRILITKGLAAGDTVVRSADKALEAGQKVKTE